jgi:hypothetical protein
MAFADDNDLVTYVPTIFDHGATTFQSELDMAEDDIIREIRVRWYNRRYNRTNWDETLLDETQWTRATVYRALSAYILPRLSTWRPEGDSFREQVEFYQARYAEELEAEFMEGVRYDYDQDGSIDGTTEEYEMDMGRLYR